MTRIGIAVRKQGLFLAELALSANVAASARAAGITDSAAYAMRRRDAGFRRRWLAALDEGYAQLELQMLERALHGVPKTPPEGEPVRVFSERLALALLSHHRETVMKERARVEAQGPGDDDDAVEEFIGKLEAIAAKKTDG